MSEYTVSNDRSMISVQWEEAVRQIEAFGRTLAALLMAGQS